MTTRNAFSLITIRSISSSIVKSRNISQ